MTHYKNLKLYGWNDTLDSQLRENTRPQIPARIIEDHGQTFTVVTETGECAIKRPPDEINLAVGDWITLTCEYEHYIYQRLLARKSKFSRAAAGIKVKEQIVATNMDYVFIIQSANKDFNIKRLERYLIATWESGATPVVVITKSDLCHDMERKIQDIKAVAVGVNVLAVSNVTLEGIDDLRSYLKEGITIALLGSSGVGKSTLVNTLMASARLKTGGIREDDSKGRHTTTHRSLHLLTSGGLLLDTPGMRTLSLWEADQGMETHYGNIEGLEKSCRFSDCKHQKEPGCAIRQALLTGDLAEERWASYNKLQKELKFISRKKAQQERKLNKRLSHKKEVPEKIKW